MLKSNAKTQLNILNAEAELILLVMGVFGLFHFDANVVILDLATACFFHARNAFGEDFSILLDQPGIAHQAKATQLAVFPIGYHIPNHERSAFCNEFWSFPLNSIVATDDRSTHFFWRHCAESDKDRPLGRAKPLRGLRQRRHSIREHRRQGCRSSRR